MKTYRRWKGWWSSASRKPKKKLPEFLSRPCYGRRRSTAERSDATRGLAEDEIRIRGLEQDAGKNGSSFSFSVVTTSDSTEVVWSPEQDTWTVAGVIDGGRGWNDELERR